MGEKDYSFTGTFANKQKILYFYPILSLDFLAFCFNLDKLSCPLEKERNKKTPKTENSFLAKSPGKPVKKGPKGGHKFVFSGEHEFGKFFPCPSMKKLPSWDSKTRTSEDTKKFGRGFFHAKKGFWEKYPSIFMTVFRTFAHWQPFYLT